MNPEPPVNPQGQDGPKEPDTVKLSENIHRSIFENKIPEFVDTDKQQLDIDNVAEVKLV